jgi:tetratricopeptide (TPR) repeat protein
MLAADAAIAAWDVDGAVAHLAAAVRGFTDRGERRSAAMACARMGDMYANGLSNRLAARGWFNRAIHLVEDEEPCLEQGWVAVAAMGCDVADPDVLRARAELALDRARRFGDVNLETKALADCGLAHVEAGRVAEGMAMLDEAMALACGGGADEPSMAAKSVCSFFTACYQTADLERFETWSALLRQYGLIGTTPGPSVIVSSHCDRVQGSLLSLLGRWQEAERILVRSRAYIARTLPQADWHPAIALAELRILQGRLDEAEGLLLGRDDHIEALLPSARLHLVRGDHDLACAAARRGLRLVGGDRVRAASLYAIVAEAELGRGRSEAAGEALGEMDLRLAGLGLPALDAIAVRARAKVLAAGGDAEAAVAVLQEEVDRLETVDLPWLKIPLLLDLARLFESAGDPVAAGLEARAATALLDRVDVQVGAADLDLLVRLGARADEDARAHRVATLSETTARSSSPSTWTAACGETRVRLRSTKGLRYLSELVARPGVEQHVVDLVDRVEGPPVAAGLDRRQLGDAGPLLDRTSRDTYRRRVEALRTEVEDALDRGDDDRAARLEAELDALVAELARAFGLSGRSRSSSSATERARLNVTRAVRAAIDRIAESLPESGGALDRRVRTGIYCAYEPHGDDDVVWIVQRELNGPHRD